MSITIPVNYTWDEFNSLLALSKAYYTALSAILSGSDAMPAAPRAIKSAVSRLTTPFQVLLYAGLFLVAQQMVGQFHLPLPANLVGMLLLFSLIMLRVVPVNWVRDGARWLLAEMLLFFVPAVVAVVNYTQLLLADGWRILLVIALSTLMVLGATGWVVEKIYRFEMTRAARKAAASD
jgi:holin-like protein